MATEDRFKRNKSIHIRVNEIEFETIEREAKAEGLTKTDLILEALRVYHDAKIANK